MKNWLIGSVAAIALLGACGGDGGDAAAGAAGQDITVDGVKVEGLTLRAGDASKAGDALTAMALNDGAEGLISFADKSTNGADATFNGVTIAVDEDSPVKAGSLSFKGLDVTDAGASFSQMTLSDISVSPPDEDGELTVSSVQLTNPSPELAAWVGSLMDGGGEVPFPALDKLSFDGLSMEGFNFAAEGVEELDVAEISQINIRNLSEDGVGAFIFEGLNFAGSADGEPFKIGLESMAISGLNEQMMAIFQASFLAGATGGDPDELAQEIFKSGFSGFGDPGYDKFTMSNFVVDAAGLGIDLPSLVANVTRDSQGRATRAVTKPFTMSVTADPEGEAGAQLAGPLAIMGYETLKFSGESDSRMDPDADTISADSASNWLALEDGFKMSLGMSATGLSDFYAKIAEDPENEAQLLAGLASLKMNKLNFEFEDNSIMEKGFAMGGALSGQDPEAMKAQAIAGAAFLPLAAGEIGIDPAIAADLGSALSKFLNDSGTLSLSINPSEPVTMADFEDPATSLTKDRLGFSATVK